jgi:hypothetical protein
VGAAGGIDESLGWHAAGPGTLTAEPIGFDQCYVDSGGRRPERDDQPGGATTDDCDLMLGGVRITHRPSPTS